MSKLLTVGLVGLGKMGRNHLRVLSMLGSIKLQFIFDSDPTVLRDLSQRYGVKPLESPVDIEGVDALVLVTPTSTHREYLEAFTGRVPYIFVEKPFTNSLQNTESVAALVKQRNTKIQCGYIERFNPAVQVLRNVLSNASQINLDFSRTNKLSSRIADVDVIFDLMIHDIDLALYLNGPVQEVVAHGAMDGDLIGFACATLTHESGVFSRVLASRVTDKKRRLIEATCRDKFVSCDLLRKEVFVHTQTKLRENPGSYTISSCKENVLVSPEEVLLKELNAFIAACKTDDFSAVPTVCEDLAAMRVGSEIQAQILRGCRLGNGAVGGVS